MTAEEKSRSFRRHGGRLSDARMAFPSAPLPWIDLSTGVSPLAWHSSRADDTDLTRLPDPTELAALEAAAAAAFGCSPAHIAAVPGADYGLRLLPRITHARSVAIASPTYSGHADAWRTAGAVVQTADWTQLSDQAEAVVVVNPNNPDGAVIPPAALLEMPIRRSGWLIVDESFADVMPDVSIAPQARDNVIVLRSFGKFYGLPGVRLGFIVADPKIIAAVRHMTGDWPVSADAIMLGRAAYVDTAWQAHARFQLEAAASRLDQNLIHAGFKILGGTPLFRLASRPDATTYFMKLAQAGILVRPFDYAPTWLRFGIPNAKAWDRVARAMEACQ